MPAELAKVFKAYDVRGVYPDEIDEDLARAVGRAFVAVTGVPAVAIGHDMRPFSVLMAAALSEGVISQGADVV